MTPDFSHLVVEISGPIASLRLDRPKKLNALSLGLLQEITAAAHWLDTQPDVRCVIVEGNGAAFCAGADLDGFPSAGDPSVRAAADAGRIMADAVTAMNAVTIASIHGWCVGGGLVLASACDLRVATESARFSIPEIALGIPLAWGGIPRLVRELGPAITKELVITCREFGSAEASALGFLNRVVEDGERQSTAQSLADQIVDKPSMPVAVTKQHVNAVSEEMGSTLNAWSDADGLLSGLSDPECEQARQAYLRSKLGG